MNKLVVLYATREGQTGRIAEHTANFVRARGWSADLFDVAKLDNTWPLGGYAAAILASSVHAGSHDRELITFVKRHRAQLDAVPSALLSVSLTEANAEDATRSPEVRLQAQTDVQTMLDDFYTSTGFRPKRVKAVAGALLYSHYGMLMKYVMKHISKRVGGPTDTSRDYEFTDWEGLDRFIGQFLDEASAGNAVVARRVDSPSS